MILYAGIDEEAPAAYQCDVECNQPLQQPPTDVVEVPDVEVKPSYTHHV